MHPIGVFTGKIEHELAKLGFDIHAGAVYIDYMRPVVKKFVRFFDSTIDMIDRQSRSKRVVFRDEYHKRLWKIVETTPFFQFARIDNAGVITSSFATGASILSLDFYVVNLAFAVRRADIKLDVASN